MMPREIPEHMRFQRPSQIRPHSPEIARILKYVNVIFRDNNNFKNSELVEQQKIITEKMHASLFIKYFDTNYNAKY